MNPQRDGCDQDLTPQRIVEALDEYIVGQGKAKRAVAIALRNRYRRRLLPDDLREEVMPKNILMVGPTGVGKTEIARRLASLARAPFVKVEATKYTEVGYVGRDVESMVRDLVEVAIHMVRAECLEQVRARAEEMALDRLVDLMEPDPAARKRPREAPAIGFPGILQGLFQPQPAPSPPPSEEESREIATRRRKLREELPRGMWDDQSVEVEVADTSRPMVEVFSSASGLEEINLGNLGDMLGSLGPRKMKHRRVTVAEARKILEEQAAHELIDMDEVTREAIRRAEESGIIFIDEIDKIADGGRKGQGPDVSREGVQRDILPIVEGSTVQTKHGTVRTDHVLFIAAGAFHATKVSDLIPELQGRLPIRVELDSLTEQDFVRILTEPRNALCRQAEALMATEGVRLEFTKTGLQEIATMARVVNEQTENIGARRLHTILERVLDDVSFSASDMGGKTVRVDRAYVRRHLEEALADEDIGRFIL